MLANGRSLQVSVLEDDAPGVIVTTLQRSHVETDEVSVLKINHRGL